MATLKRLLTGQSTSTLSSVRWPDSRTCGICSNQLFVTPLSSSSIILITCVLLFPFFSACHIFGRGVISCDAIWQLALVSLFHPFFHFLIRLTGCWFFWWYRDARLELRGIELERVGETCVLPQLMTCFSRALSKWPSSNILSICFLTIATMGVIKDVFPITHDVRPSTNQPNLADVCTLPTKMICRWPCLTMSIQAPRTYFWLLFFPPFRSS